MYLSPQDWSPRFDDSFFTIQIRSFHRLSAMPQRRLCGGNTHHPAYYYEITVRRGHAEWKVMRRYSEFQWLHRQHGISSNSNEMTLPTGMCFLELHSDDLARRRLELLQEYMDDLLRVSGNSDSEAVRTFLELDR
uniref:PX domain-containing protein n=1 Tax=Craspedostauros australis TaxID=1486917 RepID=A0A7R9ZN81_9STRA|mmetsp:Transcript_22065/g.61409  ORF Transcript_22065/g.61409 Transcript_22065/m.61409 type:complete len:135 (+) Transcript_22065:106-510(+)